MTCDGCVYDSPLGFYQRVVGASDLRRWDGDRVASLLRSFEVTYGGYLCRLSGVGMSVGPNGGLVGVDEVYGAGRLVGCLHNTVGNDGVGEKVVHTEQVHGIGSVGASVQLGSVDLEAEKVLGPNGGVSVGRGKRYARNQASRERKSKLVKSNVEESSVDVGVSGCRKVGGVVTTLQASLESKWKAENELRAFEAERKLRLLRAQDEECIVRMQRAQVMRTTEVCKVQTEKAFGTLRRTGNVGSAETVVSTPSMTDGSTARSNGESVSPDSSISQSEIRQMQKEIIDLKRESELAEKAFAKLAQLDARAVEMAREQAGIKTAFTLDTEGEAPVLTAGVIREDGKYHTLEVSEYHSHNPCYKQKYEVWNEQQCELEQRLADMGIQV